MAVDSGGRNDRRQRRAFQRLAADAIGSLALIEGDGISFTGDQIGVSLAASGGLAFSTGAVTIDLRDTDPGLELTASGLGVLLSPTDPGLSTTDGLAVIIGSGEPFSLTGGLSLELTAEGGLQVSGGSLEVQLHSNGGIEKTPTGLRTDLATDGGIQVQSNELGLKLAAASGLDLGASGLAIDPGSELEINGTNELNHAFPPGRFTDVDLRSTIATLLDVSAGQFVLIDPAAGSAQSIRLPDPTLHEGEHVTVKVIGDEAVTLLIIAQHLNNYTGLIEGIPANSGGTSFVTVAIQNQSFVITSDGVNWWFTANHLNFQEVNWKRYRMWYEDRKNEFGDTMEVPLFEISVDILNSVIFEAIYVHTSQGWFTFNSGVLNVDIVVDDDRNATQQTLLGPHQLFPQTITSTTGRSDVVTPDLISAGTVTVKAVFTVSGGTTNITDVAQGKSTVWIKWGNIGPRF